MSNTSVRPFITALFLTVSCVSVPASAATLKVGPSRALAAPCAAFAAAASGDTIEIDAATYVGDVCGVYQNKLTIRGVNGRPRIDAAGHNALGKGTWVVEGNDVSVSNVEMLGAAAADKNGAALRLEGNNFTLIGSFLHDNQNGLLANALATSNIDIETTEFGHNGAGDGLTHNVYIGSVASLTFRYNFSHDANVGHNLKSRAQLNTIAYNRFSSTPPGQTGSTASGQPSYELDFPNAGTTYVIGNVIEQPSANQNPSLLAYGEEGSSNTKQDLYVVNNTFLNDDASSGTFLFIGPSVLTPVLMQNNIFSGTGTVSTQVNAIDRTNFRSAFPGFINRAAYDLHPTDAMVVNAGSAPGSSAEGFTLTPIAQYAHPAFGESRPVDAKIDIGAYEVVSAFASPLSLSPLAVAPTDTTVWVDCAAEGKICSFAGTAQVRYGANGLYATKTATTNIACTNAVFGDPSFGTVKSCSYALTSSPAPAPVPTPAPSPSPAPTPVPAPAGWTNCAAENGTCTFSGTRQVRYGANGVYATQTGTASIGCNNAVFGDPVSGVVKSCQYSSVDTSLPATPTWTACASEGGTCNFVGKRQVRYGANGLFATQVGSGSLVCNNAVFGDPAFGVAKSCAYSSASIPDAPTNSTVTSADKALYSATPWGVAPPTGFYFLNNTFGKGNFVNGTDYSSTLSTQDALFPNAALLQWKWPNASSGSAFAYGYPELVYGGTPYGNPYNSVGPWPQRVVDNKTFVANYNISLGGNLNSYDVLLDVYVTATPTSTDGTHVAEISFFPHFTDPNNLTGIHAFSWGRASVSRQGQQILIRPVNSANAPMDILSGAIDFKEIFNHLVSLGWITGNEYLRGAEFGSEAQVPNSYNSLPHQGSMLINQLNYNWK